MEHNSLVCFTHGTKFDLARCYECQAIVMLSERLQMIEELSDAVERGDGVKIEEISNKIDIQNEIEGFLP